MVFQSKAHQTVSRVRVSKISFSLRLQSIPLIVYDQIKHIWTPAISFKLLRPLKFTAD